jgi:predicted TIM-barrel fold metal-dependent hydrolase
MTDPTWQRGLRAVAEAGLRFDLQLYPEQMAAAADLFSRYADMPVILDHAGSPYDPSEDGQALWRAGTARLAEVPQVSVKLSGWGMFDAGWTGESITPQVAHLLEVFGPERVMFGSNYPVEKLAKPYDAMLRELHGVIERLDPGALPLVFRDTALRVYQPSA